MTKIHPKRHKWFEAIDDFFRADKRETRLIGAILAKQKEKNNELGPLNIQLTIARGEKREAAKVFKKKCYVRRSDASLEKRQSDEESRSWKARGIHQKNEILRLERSDRPSHSLRLRMTIEGDVRLRMTN